MSDDDSSLLITGSKNQPFVVSLSEFKGKRLLDIRKYFRSNGELVPTKKGVSINRIQFDTLSSLFLNEHDRINSWFSDEVNNYKTNKDRSIDQNSKERFKENSYQLQFSEWKDYNYFKFEQKGGEHVLQLNLSHQWVKKLKNIFDHNNDDGLTEFITLMIVSFCRSVSLMGNDNAASLEYLETLSFNWGMFLKTYYKEE